MIHLSGYGVRQIIVMQSYLKRPATLVSFGRFFLVDGPKLAKLSKSTAVVQLPGAEPDGRSDNS